MDERLDLLIFGATGFTGKHCIPYLQRNATRNETTTLTWGISGRSGEKLKKVLEEMSSKTGVDLSGTPIILADIKDDDSLLKMAQRTRVLINCCGPFSIMGEPVVKACIEAGTNYVDVNGEPEFLEALEKYHKAASQKGVYIVSACGLDCIPSDLGLIYVQNRFEGTLNSVVTYLDFWEEGAKKIPGPSTNYGTWESAVNALESGLELKNIQKLLCPKGFPNFKPTLKPKFFPHRPSVADGLALPFPGADRDVIRRTQQYLYENENKRPIQVDTQFIMRSIFDAILLVVGLMVSLILVKFKCGKGLLLKYPHIFTNGMFEKDKDPSEEKIENILFQMIFCGEGWSEKLANKDDQYTYPPNKSIVTRIKGRNPGYGVTCICVVGSAIMMATEKQNLPKDGGVYTPGIAFGKTSLIKFLVQNGISFEVVYERNLKN